MSDRKHQPTTVRMIAPEDIRPGVHLAILHDVVEVFLPGCDDPHRPRLERVRLQLLPDERGPLKVVDVCLPFVFVKEAGGELRTLDARQHRFAQLDKRFARNVARRLQSRHSRSRTSARRQSG